MHQKISYEIFSKRGKYHEEQGKGNEDAINVVINGDYIFVILSDGAGSSDFAKEAALTTVETVSRYCYKNAKEIFEKKETIKGLVFDLQRSLKRKALKINTDLSNMLATLVVLAINSTTKKYATIHIGDGLIAQGIDNNWKIISYPEHGPTYQYTYFTNSKNVFKHLRINEGECQNVKEFIVSSDGLFEDCYSSNQMTKRLSFLSGNSFSDDTTYCKVFFNMVQ